MNFGWLFWNRMKRANSLNVLNVGIRESQDTVRVRTHQHTFTFPTYYKYKTSVLDTMFIRGEIWNYYMIVLLFFLVKQCSFILLITCNSVPFVDPLFVPESQQADRQSFPQLQHSEFNPPELFKWRRLIFPSQGLVPVFIRPYGSCL